jgi:hypothetical protein
LHARIVKVPQQQRLPIGGGAPVNNKSWNPFRKGCIVAIPRRIESDLTSLLEPGDIVLYRALGHQVLGGLITDITDSPYSHCEVYARDGWTIEAGVDGVSYSDGMHGYKGGVDILRWKGGLTEDQKKRVVMAAEREIGDPYQYTLLLLFPFLSRKALARRAAIHSFICSELVAHAYAENGLNSCDNGELDAADAPADFGYSRNLDWLGCYVTAEKNDQARRNLWNDQIQGRRNSFDKALVALLVNPFSMKTDYYEKLAQAKKALAAHRARQAERSFESFAHV